MTEDKNWKILQIIPAQPGWKAVHCEGLEHAEMKISNRSIVCWALVESDQYDGHNPQRSRRTERPAVAQSTRYPPPDLIEVG